MSKEELNRFNWPVVGHKSIVSYLKSCLITKRTAQAYLFFGPASIGKALVAENFVNSLVCKNLHEKSQSIPCGQCDCCRQVANKIHPDIFWLKREIDEKKGKLKKNISIEQVRALQNKLSLCSFLDSYKVAVIDGAEALSLEAANSLLKTLEEPTPKTVLILLATSIASLPKTIVSRCQLLKFLPVGDKEIFNHLISLKVERKKAKTLAALSFGRPGIALNYLAEPDEYINFQEQIKQFLNLFKANINDQFKIIGELVNFNDIDGAKEILAIWRKVLRDLILIKYSGKNLVSNPNLLSSLEQLAVSYKTSDLVKILKAINAAERYLAANVNPKLTLENLVLSFFAKGLPAGR